MANPQQLSSAKHRKLKVKTSRDVSDLVNQSVLPLVVAEFTNAAAEFPICFIRTNRDDEYQCVALMGIEQNENLFVENSAWQGLYMPARYTHKPFGVFTDPNNPNNFTIAIDEDSPLLSETEGEALFNEDGTESEFMGKQKEALKAYVEQDQLTRLFVKELQSLDLLVQQQVNVNLQGQKFDIEGVYIVDEQKLNELSDEKFLNMRQRGMLGPIYTHLISMRQVNNLMKRKVQYGQQKAAESAAAN